MVHTETKSQTITDNKALPVKRNRCITCNKRVGLTGFACRCGGLFCGAHRSENEHKCTFDFTAAANQTLETNLIKIDNSRDQLMI